MISWDTCSITNVLCNMAIRLYLGIHIHNKTDPKFETVDILFTPEIIIVRTSLWISLQVSHCLKWKVPQEGSILQNLFLADLPTRCFRTCQTKIGT